MLICVMWILFSSIMQIEVCRCHYWLAPCWLLMLPLHWNFGVDFVQASSRFGLWNRKQRCHFNFTRVREEQEWTHRCSRRSSSIDCSSVSSKTWPNTSVYGKKIDNFFDIITSGQKPEQSVSLNKRSEQSAIIQPTHVFFYDNFYLVEERNLILFFW